MAKGGLAAELRSLARELGSDARPAPVARLLEEELRLAQAKQPGGARISTYNWLHIPGLLQTEAWGRAVMAAYGADPEAADTGWALRSGRQELVRSVPQEFFIGEIALRGSVLALDSYPERRVAHHGQLAHLLQQQATRPEVSIRALPGFAENILRRSYHRAEAIRGAPLPEFIVLRDPRGRIAVYSDGLDEGPAMEPPGILQDLSGKRMLEQLAGMNAIALSPEDSTAYIAEIMNTFATAPPPAAKDSTT